MRVIIVGGICSRLSCGHKGCSLQQVSITSFLPLKFFVFLRLFEYTQWVSITNSSFLTLYRNIMIFYTETHTKHVQYIRSASKIQNYPMLKHWCMYADLTLRHGGLNIELNNVHELDGCMNTVIPRLTKIIRSAITFVSRNVISRRVSIENRLIRSGCCPLFKHKFYKIVKITL